jgi:CDP-glucose 4,6-dehydratase
VAAGQRTLEDLVTAPHWLDRPVLVTGATGLLGSWLVKRLLASHANVVCLVRDWVPQSEAVRSGALDQVTVVRGDICDLEILDRTLAEYEIDTVFHLAAQTIVGVANRSPAATFEVNVRGAWNVFEACRAQAVELVLFASSDKAYGSSDELPYREDFPLRAAYPYDASKAAADVIARGYAETYGLTLAVTRFANIYGGGDLNFTRLIPETAIAVAEGRSPVIRSDGSPKRDFLHVDDAVSAYLAIAAALGEDDGAAGEAFNAGGDRPHSVREVVDLIAAVSGSDVVPEYGPGLPSGEIRDQYLDSSKLTELTGWRPAVELRDGLARTLDWYREHPEVSP